MIPCGYIVVRVFYDPPLSFGIPAALSVTPYSCFAINRGSLDLHAIIRKRLPNKSWLGNRCQRWSRVCFHSVFPLASVPSQRRSPEKRTGEFPHKFPIFISVVTVAVAFLDGGKNGDCLVSLSFELTAESDKTWILQPSRSARMVCGLVRLRRIGNTGRTSRTIQPLGAGLFGRVWRWWYRLVTHCLVMLVRGGCASR